MDTQKFFNLIKTVPADLLVQLLPLIGRINSNDKNDISSIEKSVGKIIAEFLINRKRIPSSVVLSIIFYIKKLDINNILDAIKDYITDIETQNGK